MRIGVSTACFYPRQTEETVRLLRQTGAQIAEVFLEAFSETEPGFCRELKKQMDDAGIEVRSVHGFVAAYEPFLFSEYTRRAKDALQHYRGVVRASRILGAKYHTFHGNRLEYYKPGFDFPAYAKIFDELCTIADGEGVQLAWENVSWCQSSSTEFLKRSMEYIHSQTYGFTLDLKQATRAGRTYQEYLDLFGSRLLNVHISDSSAISPCLLPGRGQVDYPAVLRDLKRHGYQGDCIIEVYQDAFQNVQEITDSVTYLKEKIIQFESQTETK